MTAERAFATNAAHECAPRLPFVRHRRNDFVAKLSAPDQTKTIVEIETGLKAALNALIERLLQLVRGRNQGLGLNWVATDVNACYQLLMTENAPPKRPARQGTAEFPRRAGCLTRR